MTQWTSQQLKCLEAIGVPVYAYQPAMPRSDAEAETATAEAATPRTNTQPQAPAKVDAQADTQASGKTLSPADTTTYYKLGPWVLEFNETIPVESYDWLRDLATYCQSTPVQVSATDIAVDIKKYSKNQLNTAEKKELWRLLKASL